MKYYVSNIKHSIVLDAESKQLAADKFAGILHARGIDASGLVDVNEKGFPNPYAFNYDTINLVEISAA